MTAPPPAVVAPLAVPPAARAVLAERGVSLEELAVQHKLGLRRPVSRLGAPGLVVEVAHNDEGRRRISRELWARAWATLAGLPTAAVYGAGPGGEWLIAEWVPPAPPTGGRYIECALGVATAIAAADPPPSTPGASIWRSPRRAALVRTARAVVGRMPLRLWWAARTVARTLPQVPIAHGDFYHRNVLWRPERDEVCIVDWEYLGPGPRHGDMLRMWTVLPDRRDRDTLLERLFAATPPSQHREIATLALWLSLRLLGENIKSPAEDRNGADLAHAWSLQPEARQLARDYGAWPL